MKQGIETITGAELKRRLAEKYGIDNPERISLDKATQYENSYLSSPGVQLDVFLDKLAEERKAWRFE